MSRLKLKSNLLLMLILIVLGATLVAFSLYMYIFEESSNKNHIR
jgi:hypothetical protein